MSKIKHVCSTYLTSLLIAPVIFSRNIQKDFGTIDPAEANIHSILLYKIATTNAIVNDSELKDTIAGLPLLL